MTTLQQAPAASTTTRKAQLPSPIAAARGFVPFPSPESLMEQASALWRKADALIELRFDTAWGSSEHAELTQAINEMQSSAQLVESFANGGLVAAVDLPGVA